MKKTLLAVAALVAVSGSAFAQSSLTIYGVLDASLENVKAPGAEAVTAVSSDNYATSRLGFKGIEDLGGGLKAMFALEHNVKVDTGAQGNGPRFWDRAAWVGLAGDFGDLRLGRIDSSIGLLAGNTSILGAQNYDDFRIAGTYAGVKYRRLDNAITYSLPTLLQGFTAQVQYSLASGTSAAVGTETANVDTGKTWSLNVSYTGGPLSGGAAYIRSEANAGGTFQDSAALAFLAYDFGGAKLTGYYNVDSRSGAAEKKELLGVKVGVPISTDFSLTAGLSRVKNSSKLASDDDATILALKGVYNLSKRTAVYGLVTAIKNDDFASLAVNANAPTGTGLGQNSRGVAIGVRHAF